MMLTTNSEKAINFSFLNYQQLQNNLIEIVEYVNKEKFIFTDNEDELKKNYLNSLNTLQKTNLQFEKEIIIQFNNELLIEKMAEYSLIDKEDLINNKHLFNEKEQAEVVYKIQAALSLIKVLHEDLYRLINQYISTILIIKKEGVGGGSVSGLLGFIWLNVQPKWSIIDFAEHIYHEFIHNSLFVDDMVNCVFPDPLACAEPDGLVTSTILKIKRPLDKSFHAACVSVGIMHLYYMLRDLRTDRNYMNDFSSTLDEINEKTYLLGEQGFKNTRRNE